MHVASSEEVRIAVARLARAVCRLLKAKERSAVSVRRQVISPKLADELRLAWKDLEEIAEYADYIESDAYRKGGTT